MDLKWEDHWRRQLRKQGLASEDCEFGACVVAVGLVEMTMLLHSSSIHYKELGTV